VEIEIEEEMPDGTKKIHILKGKTNDNGMVELKEVFGFEK